MMFSYFMMYVKDIDEHIRFYTDIMGLECERHDEPDGGIDGGPIEVAFLYEKGKRPMIDIPMIELVANSPDAPPIHCGYQVGLTVDSVERVDKLMQENGYPRINGPMYREDGRVTIMEYVGPEGLRVGIIDEKW